MTKLTGRIESAEIPAQVPTSVILQTLELTRRFDKFTAVDSLNISVTAGEVFGLLGPNGAGKSTVIKMLTTLLPVSSGEAYLAGYDVTRQPESVRRVIGYVPQALSADGSLTGYENLLIFSKLYDIPSRRRKQQIAEVLEFMGLEDAAHRLVGTYSGGMIRKLEIAQAILHQPQILFLDEPTVGLDPVARSQVWQLMEELRVNFGTTIFLTTHFLEEANTLCNRVVIMNQGKEIITGSPADLKAAIAKPDATLDDVFIHYAGNQLVSGVSYRETARTRRTTQRLG
ncbi:ATP-binding cassette domain-containing protein [Anabaena cylindrica FACHB-243]|uniref:Sulfate-transporting ATPase n=1 Tax=Anabaena cylindrica (strain ATCC 27899 / PCC 7122) TaxID=272123 RepID=K9ZK68_ANACC|nr:MULTISPECIES: ATP-binding cassette domain-containing protein [Anabaena]AFZ59606.1 Sulfate-transporting ATPase [Anabaena cylindrica PCC 7122]MBD2418730.1 ATP-binding cassette domain-containing protein [Anabaena cylindrica FACHB-243]MBY5281643.1 ATP-binding cassette domain-containing protein [Anabaena sp. CCAP 1446/1C]MBY5309169.1 ATP-binding cassette domain-containing protein [Anabaena sp. CCAP 1446/1C]MCM2406294.1 ATP-binding cassette domain-containing protein [Anabaena sp. CCAP 1446/1C]